MSTMTNRIAIAVLLLVSLFVFVGCGSSGKTTINGRIITGTVGQAVTVGATDERLKEDGLAGLSVAVLSKGGSVARGRGVYATATSDELGDFQLVFPSGTFPSDVVVIQVSGEGIFTARSTTYMPTSGGSLLCIVIPRPGYVAPEQNRSGE